MGDDSRRDDPADQTSSGDETSLPLESVPDPDGQDGLTPDRAPVARWAVALNEPLVPTAERVQADNELARFIKRNPDWSAIWFAGVTHDVMLTLPPDDPWRSLTGAVDLTALETGRPGRDDELLVAKRPDQPLPRMTGALRSDGAAFGTLDDCTDLVVAELGDAPLDVGLAAVATPLSPLAAAMLAFASLDLRVGTRTYRDVYHALWLGRFASSHDRKPSEAFLEAASSALRWAIWRRRVYTGLDDPYATVVAFAWMAKTDRLRTGNLITDEGGLHASALIDPNAYRGMTEF